jgi:hypothetical protein
MYYTSPSMSEVKKVEFICPKCHARLEESAAICTWCGARVRGEDAVQRIRVRKRRNPAKKYLEHIRRHWLYFVLAILAALFAAWVLLDYAQRPPHPAGPAALLTIGHFDI